MLGLVLAGAWLSQAWAQPSPTAQAAAEALFQEGRRLMVEGRHAEACPKLAESQRLDPGDGTLLMLAQCHELTGRTATAWVLYSEVAGNSRKERRPDRERLAQERLSRLAGKLSKLTLRTSPRAAALPGLVVRLDETPLGAASFGVPLPVDPGEHRLLATAPGHLAWWSTIRIEQTTSHEVSVPDLVEAPAAEPSASAPPAPASASAPPAAASAPAPAASSVALLGPVAGEARGGRGSRSFVTYTTLGLGAASSLVGAYLGLRSISRRDSADEICQARECSDARAVTLSQQSVRDGTLSTVFVGAGLLGLGAGAVLLLTAPPATAAGPSWGVRVAGPGVSVAGSF